MVLLGFVLLNHSEIADKISNHITPGNPISLLLIKRNTSDSLVTNQKPQSIATEQIRFWEHKPKQWIFIHLWNCLNTELKWATFSVQAFYLISINLKRIRWKCAFVDSKWTGKDMLFLPLLRHKLNKISLLCLPLFLAVKLVETENGC